jgi:hypothetical protein
MRVPALALGIAVTTLACGDGNAPIVPDQRLGIDDPSLARADHPARRQHVRTRTLTLRDVSHSPLAWSLALYFGLQALHAYAAFGWLPQIFRDAGVNATHAGLLLAILPACGIPMSLIFPSIAVRLANQRPIVVGCAISYLAGYFGLLLAPQQGALATIGKTQISAEEYKQAYSIEMQLAAEKLGRTPTPPRRRASPTCPIAAGRATRTFPPRLSRPASWSTLTASAARRQNTG